MSEEIEIRYSLDDNGEVYFPVTHYEAIEGLEIEDDDLITVIQEMKSKIEEQEQTISDLDKRLELLESKEVV